MSAAQVPARWCSATRLRPGRTPRRCRRRRSPATITDLAGNALSTLRPAGDICRRHRQHHGADDQRDCGIALERRPRCRQDGHLTLTMSEVVTVNTTGGSPTLTLNDGGTATYSRRLRHQRADLQLYVGAGQNTAALAAIGGQSQRRHHQGWRRQCRQPVADRPDPDRPADRHHGADDHRSRDVDCSSGDSMPARCSR